MAKNSVSDWSTSPGLNSDVGATNIAELCAPGNLNDAIRKMMAQIAAWSLTLLSRAELLFTAAGGAPSASGFWFDSGGAHIYRMTDRLMVGTQTSGTFSGAQGGDASTSSNGANWAARDATIMGMAPNGLIGVAGFARASNRPGSGPTETIGVAGFAINDGSSAAWALYADMQLESTASEGLGLEIAVKNKGANKASTAYYDPRGAIGIWLPGGGDNAYGGAAANPNNAAIHIGKGATTWNSGIVFDKAAITGCDGTSGLGNVLEMAKGHVLHWAAPGNMQGAYIYSAVATAGRDVGMFFQDNNITFVGQGLAGFSIDTTAGAANFPAVASAVSGQPVQFKALGTDATIDLYLVPRGTSGRVKFGTFVSGAPAATGYIEIKDAAGVVRKLLCA